MFLHNLFKHTEIRRVPPNGAAATTWILAAGTTDADSGIVDTLGYECIAWVVAVGVVTATGTVAVEVQQGAASNMSDAADLTGTRQATTADGDAGKLILIDVGRVQERYQRIQIDRSTANVVIDGVFAILYNPAYAPVTQGATVFGLETFSHPAEGTA